MLGEVGCEAIATGAVCTGAGANTPTDPNPMADPKIGAEPKG